MLSLLSNIHIASGLGKPILSRKTTCKWGKQFFVKMELDKTFSRLIAYDDKQ